MKTSSLMTVIIFLMLAGCTGGSGKSLATWSGGKITEQDLKALLLINPALGTAFFKNPPARWQLTT